MPAMPAWSHGVCRDSAHVALFSGDPRLFMISQSPISNPRLAGLGSACGAEVLLRKNVGMGLVVRHRSKEAFNAIVRCLDPARVVTFRPSRPIRLRKSTLSFVLLQQRG